MKISEGGNDGIDIVQAGGYPQGPRRKRDQTTRGGKKGRVAPLWREFWNHSSIDYRVVIPFILFEWGTIEK